MFNKKRVEYSFANRVQFWNQGFNMFFDIDGTIASMDKGILRPGIEKLFELQTSKYKHRIYLWSSGGVKRCKSVADRFGLNKYVSGYFEKPPYDSHHNLRIAKCNVVPTFCYDDDPSDVIKTYGGLVVKPFVSYNIEDEEYIAMIHFAGVFPRRLHSTDLFIKYTSDYRII